MKFTIADDKPQMQEEKEAVQDLLANDSIKPITLSAIGIGLLSLVTVLGVRMWRGVQQTTVVASSGADMPSNSASALGDGLMEMKSQDPNINKPLAFNSSQQMSSQMVGGGQMSSQNSPPLTLCYAEPPWAGEETPADADGGKAYIAGIAALSAGAVVLGVDAKLVAGAAVAGIVLGADKNRAFEDVTKSVGEVALSVGEPLIEKAGPKLLEAASAASDKAASAAKSSSSKSD
jgi:hypothetical protein